ncbi:hypothetical protein P3W85_22675 [Cupriavidus basilensis]|uniref:Uncharacterized protein n=1 Tax=Cupriavidus basilensis TaxID=68895 RepID=A0ABT6ASX4_9BURK|nr:hypothetical protein [Cupriavidus basilensis]MDF3835730.1 hypothetical protein [Cupriavidus basilensis]
MNNTLDAIFAAIDMAATDATAKGDKWIVIDCVYGYLDKLETHDYQQVLACILALIEKYPELDYGGPGPFGTFIEGQPVGAYTPQLLDSLQRQPSSQVVSWLDRTMRMEEEEREKQGGTTPAQFARALKAVLLHPSVSEDCKSFAQMCLADIA